MYSKQNFKEGQVLEAAALNHMENGIFEACQAMPGSFRLIERFTTREKALWQRNREPDGTPYHFRRVAVKISKAAETEAFTGAFVMASGGTSVAEPRVKFEKYSVYGYVEAGEHHGYWENQAYAATSQGVFYESPQPGGADFTLQQPVSSQGITEIRVWRECPPGVTFEIWGVDM